MLDNMVLPLQNGDVDVSMLKEAVDVINGRFETEVSNILCYSFTSHLNILLIKKRKTQTSHLNIWSIGSYRLYKSCH